MTLLWIVTYRPRWESLNSCKTKTFPVSIGNHTVLHEVSTQCNWNVVPLSQTYGSGDLPHWGRVTHICVSILTIIGSDNGLSPGRRQSIFWINAGLLSIGPVGTNFSEILIDIYTFQFMKMHVKMLCKKNWRPFYLGLNVLTQSDLVTPHGVMYINHCFR